MLASAGRPLVDLYDLLMFDLDGVVYVGEAAVPGASDALRRVRDHGAHVAFVTNNASRPPGAVAEKLSALGIPATRDDVVTSAQAAAHLLVERHGRGAAVAVLGDRGLLEALEEVGMRAVEVGEDAVAVVTGYAPDVVWRDIMVAATRIRTGLPWVASNTDLTLPTPQGIAPGHGTLVRLLADFAGVTPDVAGKPEPPLLEETIRRVGGARPLMVGDRLDTDVEGGRRVGVDTLLVLTGVTGLAELVSARVHERPSYLAADLSGLHEAHGAPDRGEQGWTSSGWTARVMGDGLTVTGGGPVDGWWRCAAAAAWEHLDRTGAPVDISDVVPPVAGVGR